MRHRQFFWMGIFVCLVSIWSVFFSFLYEKDVDVASAAGPITWDGGAGDSDWCSALNWSTDAVPTSTSDVTINSVVTVITTGCIDGGVNFNSLTLGGAAASVLQLSKNIGSGGDITINSSGVLEQMTAVTQTITGSLIVANGGILRHGTNNATQDYEVDFSATTIDIQVGGSVNVDYRGYASGQGPGTAATGSWGSGASHAGNGALGSSGKVPGNGYCTLHDVSTMGSGGGKGNNGSAAGGPGGGYIKLQASGTLTINGTITSDGKTAGTTYGGGGAGGGIKLIADTIAGTPTSFTAHAGNGSHASGSSGGGGGCVQLNYTTANSITAAGISVYGGSVYAIGGAGSIFIQQNGTNGDLTIKNTSAGAGRIFLR